MMASLFVLVALALQPEQVVSRLFAATTDGPYVTYSCGVFKSSDGGESFRPMTEGLGAPSVNELATFPAPVQDRERSR